MPRYSFSNSALKGASSGLGKLAAAIAGAGRTGKDAYDKELITQSRIGQAIASAQANQAKAELDRKEAAIFDGRRDINDLLVAGKAGTTVPVVNAARDYLRTGVMPERELPGPADEAGNGPGSAPLVSPEQLSAISREIARWSPSLLGNKGDNKIDDVAKAEQGFQEADLQRQAVDGSLSPGQTSRAMALLKASPIYNRDSTGSVLDQFTGALDTENPLAVSTIGLRKDQAAQARAGAAENYAQAGSARATADLRRQQASAVGQGGGKAPSGYQWSIDQVTGDPRLQPIPGGPADPTVSGKPPGEVQRMNIALRSLDEGLNAYEALLKDFNPRSPQQQVDPQIRAKAESLVADLQLQLKEAQALGALTGPDVMILERALANPVSLRGAIYGREGLGEQLKQTRDSLKRRKDALSKEYNTPNLTPPDAPAQPKVKRYNPATGRIE